MAKFGCIVAVAVVAVIVLAGCGGGGGAQTVTAPAANAFAGTYTANVTITGVNGADFSWGFSVASNGTVTSGDIPQAGATVTGSVSSGGEITIQITSAGQPSVTLHGTIHNAGGVLGGSGTWTQSDGASGTWTCKVGLDTSAVAGNYSGTYAGDEAGTFTLSVTTDGRVTGQGVSPSTGSFSITGTLWPGGTVSLAGSGSAFGGPWTATWHGNVNNSGSGAGTWVSSTGYSGTWIMHK